MAKKCSPQNGLNPSQFIPINGRPFISLPGSQSYPEKGEEPKGLSQFGLLSRRSDSAREQGWLKRRETGQVATGYTAVTVLRVREARDRDWGESILAPREAKRESKDEEATH